MSTDAFETKLHAAWPPDWREVGVVLAVSGGADSVALLRATARLATSGSPARIAVSHFNHRLRGAESDADEELVRELCKGLAIECLVARAEDASPVNDVTEAALRQSRYQFLQRSAESLGARYLATAHTLDDQAETILHHVLRGTGLAGLAGISRVRPLGPAVTLLRPMLGLSRREVLAYLAALGQPFREDSTNHDVRFTRNRIRHELLPALARDYSPTVIESLGRLGTLAADAQAVVEREACRLLDRMVVTEQPGHVTLTCAGLAAHDRHLVREAFVQLWRRGVWPLAAMGFDDWNRLADMALSPRLPVAESIKHVFPGRVIAERQGDQLLLDVP